MFRKYILTEKSELILNLNINQEYSKIDIDKFQLNKISFYKIKDYFNTIKDDFIKKLFVYYYISDFNREKTIFKIMPLIIIHEHLYIYNNSIMVPCFALESTNELRVLYRDVYFSKQIGDETYYHTTFDRFSYDYISINEINYFLGINISRNIINNELNSITKNMFTSGFLSLKNKRSKSKIKLNNK